MMRRPLLVGISGGTGSGKTTVAQAIREVLGDRCIIISQDSYYRDNSGLPLAERATLNYDHPSAFDNELLTAHLQALRGGETIDLPTYSFETYVRLPEVIKTPAAEVVLVEGLLIFDDPKVRSLFDIRIFVDTDADIRVIRRILRDVQERGRTLDSVCWQYQESVKPMHEAFVEPSKRHADIILPEGAYNAVGMDVIISKIRLVLRDADRVRSASHAG